MASHDAFDLLTEEVESSTFQEAMRSSHKWKPYIEIRHENLLNFQKVRKSLIKRDGNDQVERYRAILVVKGYAKKKLTKSLYNLKQAPRCWYKRFDSFIISLNYNIMSSYHCTYYNRFDDNDFIILLYVNDIWLREFDMKDLGPANKILGMQIHRDRKDRKVWLSQKNYLLKILRRFNMQDCKPISTPLLVNYKLSSSISPSSEEERMEMSRVSYASAVGSLVYAMICTRPDFAQVVGVVSKFMGNPSKEHCNDLRYIKGTSGVALCYGGSELLVRGYVDSDFAGDVDKRKSTTGYVFTIAGGAVSWLSKLQDVIALSTTEAEYMVVTQEYKEAILIKRLMEELGHKQQQIVVYCDSQSALHIARNPAFHSRTKHIAIRYHFVREVILEHKFQKNHGLLDLMIGMHPYKENGAHHPKNVVNVHRRAQHPKMNSTSIKELNIHRRL
ncbi:hypothetical protein CR513_47771, partial [Mucuna pruriens]